MHMHIVKYIIWSWTERPRGKLGVCSV